MFIALYVDDLIFTGNNVKLIEAFKEVMKKEFEMTDLGLMKYFLGLEVIQGNVELEHVESQAQAAYMFTKPLPSSLFENNKMILEMKDKKII